MQRMLSVFLIASFLAAAPFLAKAQDAAAQAAALAERRESEERYKRLSATLDELTEAFGVQQKRINTLVEEINRLREENLQLSGKFSGYVSREDLRKLAEKVQEIETKRESDRKLILEEIQRLAKVAATPPPTIERRPAPSKTPAPDPTENFYPYKVKKGETLSEIIKLYNADLKEKGLPPITLEQVRKANPKVNPDKLQADREILLPVPNK